MRLTRGLAHLALALVLLVAALAPARAVGSAFRAMPSSHVAMDHGLADAHASEAHEHACPASGHPVHASDHCRTACCFVPSRLPPRAPASDAVELFRVVRYPQVTQAVSGETGAPEPGIPKA